MRKPAVPLSLLPQLLLSALALAQAPADLGDEVRRYAADLALVARRHDSPMSAAAREHRGAVLQDQLDALAAMDFEALPRDARIDWILLHGHARHEQQLLARAAAEDVEATELLPFAGPLVALHEHFRDFDDVDPRRSAATLASTTEAVAACQQRLEASPPGQLQRDDGTLQSLSPSRGLAAVERCEALQHAVSQWFRFRNGYDPQFTFWCSEPFARLDGALSRYRQLLQQRLVDRTGDASLVGAPIGAAALRQELDLELIPYTPQELIEIAEQEFAFCDAEMLAASRQLGCGDDWHAALELVKQLYVEPGRQPALVRDLAREAIEFVTRSDLVTVPALCRDGWRMGMMSKNAQRVNPFFLGGETILVSYPTADMTQDEKLQSLRSNNVHFARATVLHELIPGHWLQEYMQSRYRPYRQRFETPFWIEGWALYWEMRLYALGFPRGPEDKVGMLYWRKHRCARIVFSLRYHLGEWTPQQCIDYLIERVGHEPAAAAGEVRRSISGGYGPLYQCAYMLGGLQLRALHDELVVPGGMSEKTFHDAVLQQNAIPIALVRAALQSELPAKDAGSGWRFAGR